MRTFLSVLSAALPIALVSPFTLAETENHQIEYFWDVGDGNDPVELGFPQFDTMNGTRELTGVTVSLDGQFDLTMSAENMEPDPVLESDWFVDSAILMFFDFDDLPIGPLTGGGLGVFSSDLAGNDRNPGTGDDYTEWSYSDQSAVGDVDINDTDFSVFRGEGTLDATLYPFLSLGLSAPPPRIGVDVVNHAHIGTITVTYEWQSSAGAVLTVNPLPLIAGAKATISASNMFPDTLTFLAMSTRGTGNVFVPQLQITVDLRNPRQVMAAKRTDNNGDVTWVGSVPEGWTGRTVWLQAAQKGLKTKVVEAPID